MKKRFFQFIIPIILISLALGGCNAKMVKEHINDPIAASGDLAYYANLDMSTFLEKHIELTAPVSNVTYSYIDFNGIHDDDYDFTCYFSSHVDELDTLQAGDIVTLHGVCTTIYKSIKSVSIEGCQIIKIDKQTNETTSESSTPTVEPTDTSPIEVTTEPATEPTTPPTTEPATEPTTKPVTKPSTPPATEPATPPTTKPATPPPTEPPHTHKYSNATCTTPKTCSCGATEGDAKGHSWKAATCSDPKTCTVCGVTSGLTAGHNFSGGKCSVCGKADPDYTYTAMVWIPTKGGTKYHTHAGCSNMEDPRQVTESEAESLGFTPCKRCH